MSQYIFPKYVVLQAASGTHRVGKYLSYVPEGVRDARHGYIQLDGNQAVSPYTKFEIEPAHSTINSPHPLVHIKSCFNNKYWARVSSIPYLHPQWLAARADKPEEDRSNWACTLFQAIFSNDGTVAFRHYQLQMYADYYDFPNQGGIYCLHLRSYNGRETRFRVTDWESLSILPDYVAFKGVDKGRYVMSKVVRNLNHLEMSATDIGLNSVRHRAFNAADGSLRIRSDSFNRFWKLRPSDRWVVADATQNDNSKETLFQPVDVGEDDHTLALQISGSGFIRPFTGDRRTDCLRAGFASATKPTILNVEEPVFGERKIYNVSYRLQEASVYNEEPIVLVTADVSNGGTETQTLTLRLVYTEKTSRTFNYSVSIGSTVKSTITTGFVNLVDGKLEISASDEIKHTWGTTTTSSIIDTWTGTVSVKPGFKTHVSVFATEGSYKVPFSYTIRDTLSNGLPHTDQKHDGMYTGANCYSIRSETKEEPLALV